jgi:hypothetical protein
MFVKGNKTLRDLTIQISEEVTGSKVRTRTRSATGYNNWILLHISIIQESDP